MLRKFKVLFLVLAALVVAGGAYAFAAQNTIDPGAAGYATSTVSGYDISNVVYDLNDDNPQMVDNILFDVSPDTGSIVAETVKIQTADSGAWTDCTLTAGTPPAMHASCALTSTALVDVTALNVVASSSEDPTPAP